jgi:hypothetical protein
MRRSPRAYRVWQTCSPACEKEVRTDLDSQPPHAMAGPPRDAMRGSGVVTGDSITPLRYKGEEKAPSRVLEKGGTRKR